METSVWDISVKMRKLCILTATLLLSGCLGPQRSAHEARDQQVLVRFEENGKWGFRDTKGKVVIQPVYDNAEDFSCGLAPVNLGAKREFPGYLSGGKWGYIDNEGHLVVPLTLTSANGFSDGLAQVRDDQGTRYINSEGKTVIALGHVDAGDFREGLAPVYTDRSLQGKDWLTKFINSKGETVFRVEGYAEEFHEGRAVLTVRDSLNKDRTFYGYINRQGKTVIPTVFAEALQFSDGLAAVRTEKTTGVYRMGDNWGYIDKSGRYAIRPAFNEARDFLDGVGWVHVGGELQRFFDVPPFWEGGEWWLIDKKGNVLKRNAERTPADNGTSDTTQPR